MMKNLKKEHGSALVLVLFLVLVIGLMTAPLLLSTNQGLHATIRSENAEQANYTAESGAAILRRAIIESVRVRQIRMDASQINQLIGAINSANVTINGTKPQLKPLSDLMQDSNQIGFRQTTLATVGDGSRARSKEVTLSFRVGNGSAGGYGPADGGTGTGVGIFGYDGTAKDIVNQLQYFEKVSGEEITNNEILKPSFEKTYKLFFNKQMDMRPAIMTAPFPHDVAKNGSVLNVKFNSAGTPTAFPITRTGDYSVTQQTLVINGDLIVERDLTFPNYVNSIEITGNVIAGGDIRFYGYINKFKVGKSMIAGGSIAFNGINSLTVNGDLSSEQGMMFPQSLTTGTIGGSILAGGGEIKFDYIQSLTVGAGGGTGHISNSNGDIHFTGEITNLKLPSGSVIAGGSDKGEISFQNITSASINGNLSAKDNITFQRQVGNLMISGPGSIVAKEIKFEDYITKLEMSGDLSSESSLDLKGIGNLKVGGNIYAKGELEFDEYIGSLVTGGHMIADKIDFDKDKNIGSMKVGGGMFAQEKLEFPYIQSLTVKSFIASNDKIEFDKGIATPPPVIGGIATPDKIDFKGGYYRYPTILIDYWPPGSTGSANGSGPSVTIDGFGSN